MHWPFCQSKCPYCDFNSHVVASVDHSAWKTALLRELDRYRRETGPRVLNSIFFGGGTPSLMDPETVAAVIDLAKTHWTPANDIEVTLEANPTSVEAGRFRAYRDGGVNRVSLGVQALNDHDLKKLGRLHSAKEALRAFDIARSEFDRVSFDLIYARQDQTLAQWQNELSQATQLAVDHLSLYQLTIEDGTAFGDRYARGALRGLPSVDASANMYQATQEICGTAGFPAYEVSNHAKPGAESRHNLIYWRYGDYVGIGPGAHGRLSTGSQRVATEAWSAPSTWLAAAGQGKERARVNLTGAEQATEMMLMGLRLTGGIDMARYEALAGVRLDTAVLTELEEMGKITIESGQLRTTSEGRMVLNSILSRLLDG